MIIYEMTATFGKLQNEKLTLKPGLNILQAPNEWGKSTWCAFLNAMLFGVDTRAKTTKTALADKERYAPWSGSPMAGRIDLNWQGRDITIERTASKRVPMGAFRAYETRSGIAVPELTADNCGKMLLGVEQSVFRRAGFIRFSELAVTQDDALRSRLNALVTTGDDSGDGEKLAKQLRELKNAIQYNRKGKLPEARSALEEKCAALTQLRELEEAQTRLEEKLTQLKTEKAALENHRAHLEYSAFQRQAQTLQDAEKAARDARAEYEKLAAQEASCPTREEARERLQDLQELVRQREAVRTERELLPPPPQMPEPPALLNVLEPEKMVREDIARYSALKKRKDILLYILFALLVGSGAALMTLRHWLPGGICLAWGFGALIAALVRHGSRAKQCRALEEKYGSDDCTQWYHPLGRLTQQRAEYQKAMEEYRNTLERLRGELNTLRQRQEALCGNVSPEKAMEQCHLVAEFWDALEQSRREAQRSREYLHSLKSAVKQVPPPPGEDTLTLSPEETQARLSENERMRQSLRERLAQYRGQKEALDSREALERSRDILARRVNRLEDALAATVIAQETLVAARQELQRRFAPRIAKRAQELLRQLTDGRYRQLTLREDLSLEAMTEDEEILHSALWRSDGTADQLHLALRLAVAEELTPGTPLILDDALIRFDDDRLKAALKVLCRQGENRQVLLFTCQSREKQLLEE